MIFPNPKHVSMEALMFLVYLILSMLKFSISVLKPSIYGPLEIPVWLLVCMLISEFVLMLCLYEKASFHGVTMPASVGLSV